MVTSLNQVIKCLNNYLIKCVNNMKTIVFANQKGGAGKTTLTGHFSVQAEADGLGPVAIIDTDQQGSLSSWWNVRAAETPIFPKVTLATLAADLKNLEKQGVKLVVIDTPPAVTETIKQVISVADLVVIPCRPSPHDLRAVGSTIKLVEDLGKPMVFVVNGAATRAKITGEAAVALSQHGKVAPVTFFQRTDFAQSMNDGRTAQELDPNSRSAQEVSALCSYIRKQLKI
jgi:chromosome partitioning protein